MRKKIPNHFKQINILKKSLEECEFECAENIKIKDKKKNDVTDIDLLAAYKNILLIIEVKGTSDRERQKVTHLKSLPKEIFNTYRKEIFKKIKEENKKLLNLIQKFEENKKIIKILIRIEKDENEYKDGIFFMGRDTFEYLKNISAAALINLKYELFYRFKIKPNLIMEEPFNKKDNTLPCIFIDKNNKRKIVIARMKISNLLKNSLVLRYHGWGDENYFQRLLKGGKLDSMRSYLIRQKNIYPNNIILIASKKVKITSPKKDGIANLKFPEEYGLFYVIDGQHRLFSFLSGKDDKYYKKIKNFSDEKYIITTIIKPLSDDRQEGARLFLDINTTQTRVKSEDSLDIAEPLGETEVILKEEIEANKLLKKLNNMGGLKDRFKIKFYEFGAHRPSLIKYGGLSEFFDEKSNLKKLIKNISKKEFSEECAHLIDAYFVSIQNLLKKKYRNFQEIWDDVRAKEYRLMTVTVLSGFLRTLLRHFLISKDQDSKNLQKFIKKSIKDNKEKIIEIFDKLLWPVIDNFKFDKESLKNKPYKSSQWWKLEEDLVKKIRSKYTTFGDFNLIP